MSKNKIKNNIALISTRPYEKNIALFKELKSANVLLLNHPLTEIKPLEDYSKFDLILSNLNNYQHIIFISTNAVNFFVKRLKNLKIKCRPLPNFTTTSLDFRATKNFAHFRKTLRVS